MAKCECLPDEFGNENKGNWCDEDQTASCNECFVKDHINHNYTGSEQALLIAKCLANPPESDDDIKKIKNVDIKKLLQDKSAHMKTSHSYSLIDNSEIV